MNQDTKLEALLAKRKIQDSYRTLGTHESNSVDFSSNDYLGLARSLELKNRILETYKSSSPKNGSTGSRLLTGNNDLTISCEKYLAELFGFETTTLFDSGYMANLAIFSTLPQRGDTIIYDEYAHACIKDGCRLSLAKKLSFKHNDLDDLKHKLGKTEGEIYVVCESIYSMDGDQAPLKEIIRLANEFKAKVIVDEAHSTGVFGQNGSGMISALNLQADVFAVIYTFGKAMGIHGACLASKHITQEFIINYSRPFIYTTAPSPFNAISIKEAFEYLSRNPDLSVNLREKIKKFNALMPRFSSPSAIKSIIVGGNEATKALSKTLQLKGFDVRPILSPTVKEGSERLRICLHTFNSEEEINLICHLLKNS